MQTTTFVSPHDVSPTDPVWNYTAYCPLRLPPLPSSLDDRDGSEYDAIISAYWSLGTVKIEVVDSERFNEDIFLGEVTLFLSNFLLPSFPGVSSPPSLAPPPFTCREISGSFSIVDSPASASTSCTSGTVRAKHSGGAKLTAAVYLHLTNLRHLPPTPPSAPDIHPATSITAAGLLTPTHTTTTITPQKDVKSALAHIPSPCSGGLTS